MRIRVGALFLCAILLGLLAWLQFESRTARRGGREPGAPVSSDISAPPYAVDPQAAAAPEVVSSEYSGVVVDHAGRPVEAADVRWWNERTRTDSRGRFRLEFKTSVPCAIHAEHPGAGVGETETYWGKPSQSVRIVLRATSRIRGRVLTRDGAPLVKGIVSHGMYRDDKGWSDVTRVDGLGHVESDPFSTRARRRLTVRFWSDSHEFVQRELIVDPGCDVDFGVVVLAPKPQPCRISGRVEGEFGTIATVGGTRVQPDGTFDLTRAPGRLRLALSGPVPAWKSGSRAVGPTIDVAPGEWIRGYVIRVWPNVEIAGRLVGHDGRPVADQSVAAILADTDGWFDEYTSERRDAGSAQTDAAGRFRISGLIPGPYRLAAIGPDRPTVIDRRMQPVQVDAGDSVEDVKLRLTDPEVVTVHVSGNDFGKALDGLSAQIVGADGTRRTIPGVAGTFTFPRPAAGRTFLRLRAPGRANCWLLLPDHADCESVRWNVGLNRGRLVEGVVLAPDGTPARGALVRLVAKGKPADPDWATRCDSSGRFSFDRAPFGDCHVTVEHAGIRPHSEPLPKLDDKIVTVRLRGPRSR